MTTCRRIVLFLIGLALTCLMLPPLSAFARGGTPAKLPQFTPQREKAALEFVAEHHPELSGVLARLEQANRQQYEQAIRELFDTSERMALVKARDEELYALMLEGWKAQSRAEVLAARLAFADKEDPALEAELRELIARKVDLERQTIEHNRQRTLRLLEGMEKSLKSYDENRDAIIERRVNSLTSRSKKSARPQSTTPAPKKTKPSGSAPPK